MTLINKILALLLLFFFLVSCKQNLESQANQAPPQYLDTVKPQDNTTHFKSNGYTLIDYAAPLKLRPKTTFSQHTVAVYKGATSPIKPYKAYTFGPCSKEQVKSYYQKEGVNFGGHYCLMQFSCGGPCTRSELIDCQTGKIYTGVEGCGETFVFQKDSKMIIVNPIATDQKGYYTPDSVQYYFPCKYLHQIFIWQEGTKTFTRIEAIEMLFRETGVLYRKT
jgi:hypothetical protein